MNDDTKLILTILQEECAEVIQAISKIHRFGLTNHKPDSTYINQENLEEELGDMLAMIDLLRDMDVVCWGNMEVARLAKIEKLKQWSTLFESK